MHTPTALDHSSDRAIDPAVIPFHTLATGVRLPWAWAPSDPTM
jgi:hypothetical protein